MQAGIRNNDFDNNKIDAQEMAKPAVHFGGRDTTRDEVGDSSNIQPGQFNGFDYKFNKSNGSLELTSVGPNERNNNTARLGDGTLLGLKENNNQVKVDTPKGINLSDIKSIKIDSDVNFDTGGSYNLFNGSSLQNIDLSHVHKNNVYFHMDRQMFNEDSYENAYESAQSGGSGDNTFSGVPLKSITLSSDLVLPYLAFTNSYIIHMSSDASKRNKLIQELSWKPTNTMMGNTNAEVIKNNTFIDPNELIKHLRDDSDMIVSSGTPQSLTALPAGSEGQNVLTNINIGFSMNALNLSSDIKPFFSSSNIKPYQPKFYKKDANDKYTAVTPTNILDNQAHPGTWLTSPDPAPSSDVAYIQYQNKGQNVGNPVTTSKHKFNTTASVSSLNNVPTGYQFSNPAQQITYNGNTYDVPVDVKNDTDTVAFYTKHDNDNVLVSKTTVSGADGSSVNIYKDVPSNYQLANGNPNITLTANTTDDVELTLKNGQSINNPYIPEKVTPDLANADVQYQYNNQTVNSDSTDYQGNNYQATDAGDNGTTISNNNEKGLPQGWHLANKDTSISYDNGKHPVAIDPNHVSDNVIYQYNGQNVNNGYQLGSHSFGGNDYRATQAGNNGINIKQANATGLRDGYTLVNADNNIQFDGKTKYLPVKPNQISDKGTLTLNYVESNGRTDKTVTLHPAIKGSVDDTLTLAKPLDYAEDNYTVPSSDFTWTIKPSNNEPSKTFTYNAPTAGNVTIQYYDTATGNHLTQFDKTLTASDMEKAPYNLNWIVGNTVKLGIKGANDNAIDVLQAPAGYHFAKNYPAESVTLPEAQSGNRQGLTLHVGLMLMARPITPKKPNKPASSGSVTPVTPSSASAQPSSASVAPSSSASVAPSSASVAPTSVSSVTPASTSSAALNASASQSVVPSAVASVSAKTSSAAAKHAKSTTPKTVTHHGNHAYKATNHVSHKAITNAETKHLNHEITKATHDLNAVKYHVATIKTVRKAAHARRVIKNAENELALNSKAKHITGNKTVTTTTKATANETMTDKSVTDNTNIQATNDSVAPSNVSAESVTEPSNAPKSHVATQSTTTNYTSRKKLPQTGETNTHTGVVALIAMAAGAILAGFGKVFDRKHNE